MKNYSTYQSSVAAGDRLNIPRLGAYCRVLYSSQPYFNISLADEVAARIEQGIGFFLPTGQEFNSITVENPNASTLNFIMAFADGKIDDNRMSISSVLQIKGEVGPIANTFSPINVNVTTSAALILAANPARTKSVIKAGSFYDLYLGSNNSVTTATGFKLSAGETVIFEHKGAVYGIRGSGLEPVLGWEETQ